jgi:hypothetical protein
VVASTDGSDDGSHVGVNVNVLITNGQDKTVRV